MRPLIVLVVLASLLLPVGVAHEEAAHGEIVHQTYRASGVAEPGGFLEVDLEARGGDAIVWSVSASNEVNINIHEHVMGTVYHVQENATRDADGTFEVPHGGTFSLMVVGLHESGAADVELLLEGPFAITGTQGLSEAEEGPLPAPVLVLSVVVLVVFALRRRL